MQQQPKEQTFDILGLTGADLDAIMNSMNEQPSKMTRATMNKIEAQIVQQVMIQQQLAAEEQKSADAKPVDKEA